MTKFYIFYNKNTLEILSVFQPLMEGIIIENFLDGRFQYDPKFQNFSREDIDFIESDKDEYDTILAETNSVLYIDPQTKTLKYVMRDERNTCFNATYNKQAIKRNYTRADIEKMYTQDYIGFNLKNLVNSNNNIIVEFKDLSSLRIRISMSQKRWKSFYSDPYLDNCDSDRFLLGQSIMEKGTYYPIIVCKMNNYNDDLYVLEGSHRVMSLQLIQNDGQIPSDFKILCIEMPFTHEDRRSSNFFNLIPEPILFRNVIEIGYGSSILKNPETHELALSSIIENGQQIIDDYTYQFLAYTWADVLSGIDSYPHWLRDLTFNEGDFLQPSQIINNENAFLEWKEI